jgi:HlyD family secretion protein
MRLDAMTLGSNAPRRRLAMFAAAGLAVLVTAAGVAVLHRAGEAASADAPAQQSAVVQQRPFISILSVAGTISPGPGGEVMAPFDGTIRSVGFVYGERVEPGQVLVVFDPADVRARRNEAEAAYLKSSQNAAAFVDWEHGPDVSRARRAAALAESDLRDADRKVDETKALLDRGLVPRNEYEAAQRQRQAQETGLAAARQDLDQALLRGGAAPRRAAGLDLQNARDRLAELDGQAATAAVRATIGGVIVRPPADKAETAAVHPGQQMTRGQMIGAVASPDALVVTFQLGETDANRVRPGQSVTVTGTGFPGMILKGRVTAVAGEATPPSAGSPISTVAALARLEPLTPEQAAAVRIGMTAAVSIQIYANPSALVAPPAAIQGAATRAEGLA